MKKLLQTKQYLLGLIAGAALIAALGAALPGAPAQDAATPQPTAQKWEYKVVVPTWDPKGSRTVYTLSRVPFHAVAETKGSRTLYALSGSGVPLHFLSETDTLRRVPLHAVSETKGSRTLYTLSGSNVPLHFVSETDADNGWKKQNEHLERTLNEFGAQGWELVSVSEHQFVFKRSLPSAAK